MDDIERDDLDFDLAMFAHGVPIDCIGNTGSIINRGNGSVSVSYYDNEGNVHVIDTD